MRVTGPGDFCHCRDLVEQSQSGCGQYISKKIPDEEPHLVAGSSGLFERGEKIKQ
jgi:hypothetical protein